MSENEGVTGYNWRNVLGDFAAISGVLAGFTIAMVVFILGWSVADTPLLWGVTWANVGVLLNGAASGLFIAASEFFLSSKEFDAWALPQRYEDDLERRFKQQGQDWAKIKEDNLMKCGRNEGHGRYCYNLAIFLMFLSLFFVIGPYNVYVATIVSGLGIALEAYQWL
jgi:hypothetical protein